MREWAVKALYYTPIMRSIRSSTKGSYHGKFPAVNVFQCSLASFESFLWVIYTVVGKLNHLNGALITILDACNASSCSSCWLYTIQTSKYARWRHRAKVKVIYIAMRDFPRFPVNESFVGNLPMALQDGCQRGSSIGLPIVISTMSVIVGYSAQIVVEIVSRDSLSTSAGAGSRRRMRRSVASVCHNI